ncbi:hypothetical protein VTN49DRAFT_514 [Thermomyces lanuginosus]|uniref:uncharacterized protein n=1 Tax=Thermomyces lanuginosus TaxID=5541 RepID=UPI0037431BA4
MVMEQSSPLAAMQPAAVTFGHCFREEGPSPVRSMGGRRGFGPNSFNFRDLSMKNSGSDFFGASPTPGSSPAASLAADLSQNFYIDRSPPVATPRRSLFTARLLDAAGREEPMKTPPLTSSPVESGDMMDMSPLPHKPAFSTDDALDTPTRDTSLMISSSPPVGSPMESATTPSTPRERRRSGLLRPSLARSKAHSAQLGFSRPAPESKEPEFKFGNGGSDSMTLGEMFEESPQRDRVLKSSNFLGPRLRSGRGGNGVGSPNAIRKHTNGNPLARPRKQSRRSLSMFENAEDVIQQKEPSLVSPESPMPFMDEPYELQLPHFIPEDQADSLPRIDKSVMVDILNGKYNDRFQKIMIIDCRFEYEYEGGHIEGAVNYNDKEALANDLFSSPQPNTALIFHCEYSAHRAPIMASFIRHKDRAYNVDRYPKLTFPELYILDGGYSAFFAEHKTLCFPQNYVEMTSKGHEYDCERGLGKVKQRSKFIRAQTYAYGEHSSDIDESPTGRCRGNDRTRSLDVALELNESGRGLGRRMLSY